MSFNFESNFCQEVSKKNKGIPVDMLKGLKLIAGAPRTVLPDYTRYNLEMFCKIFESPPGQRDIAFLRESTFPYNKLTQTDGEKIQAGQMGIVQFSVKYFGIRVGRSGFGASDFIQKEFEAMGAGSSGLIGEKVEYSVFDPASITRLPLVKYPVQLGFPRVEFVHQEVIPKIGDMQKWEEIFVEGGGPVEHARFVKRAYFFYDDGRTLYAECGNPFFYNVEKDDVLSFHTHESINESMSLSSLFLSFREVKAVLSTCVDVENNVWEKTLVFDVMPRDFSITA